MSHDNTQLIEILRELIPQLNENHMEIDGWDQYHPMMLEETVEEFLPLLTALDISVEDLGLFD